MGYEGMGNAVVHGEMWVLLLEMVFEVSGDDVVQVDAVGASHVVSVAGIDE